MAKRKVKKQKFLTFDQLLTIFRTMISLGWKADLEVGGSIRLKCPRGRDYCYCPIGALLRFNGFINREKQPDFDKIASPRLEPLTGVHHRTALSVALASDSHCHYQESGAWVDYSRRRRQALFNVLGFSELRAD